MAMFATIALSAPVLLVSARSPAGRKRREPRSFRGVLGDAADGASHQATAYFAAVSAIPHTHVIAPSCSDEAEALMYAAIKQYAEAKGAGKDPHNYIFFVGRENYPIHWVENAKYDWHKAQLLQEGTDVVLIGCGPLLGRTIDAGKKLAEQGIKAAVINNPFINHVDLDTIGTAVKSASGRVVT